MGGRLIDWLGADVAANLPDPVADMPGRIVSNSTALFFGTDNKHLYVYDLSGPSWYDIDLVAVAGVSNESIQDMIAAFLDPGTGINLTYNDAGNLLAIDCTITQYTDAMAVSAVGPIPTQYTDEMAQDAIAALIAAGTDTGITIVYNDAGNAIGFTVSLSLGLLTDVDLSTPPTDGQVLTYDNASSKWKPKTSSGGGSSVAYYFPQIAYDATVFDTGGYATSGNLLIPYANITLNKLFIGVNNATIGNVYSAFIATVNSSTYAITGTVATATSRFTTTATGAQVLEFAIPSTTLTAGTYYMVCMVLTSGTASTACRAFYANSVSAIYPMPASSVGAMLVTGGERRINYTQNSDAPTSATVTNNTANSAALIGVKTA